MGRSFTIKCKQCDYSKTLMLGIGMLYSPDRIVDFDSEDSFLPHIIKSKKVMDHMKNLIKNKGGILRQTYEHKAYYCPECSYIDERFFFQIDYEDGIFEPTYNCPKCKKHLEIMQLGLDELEGPIDFSAYSCPSCGQHGLTEDYDSIMMWD